MVNKIIMNTINEKDCFKAIVVKDILREEIRFRGDLPKIIPKGYITWFENKYFHLLSIGKEHTVCPEKNRWFANIPTSYFKILNENNIYELW